MPSAENFSGAREIKAALLQRDGTLVGVEFDFHASLPYTQ